MVAERAQTDRVVRFVPRPHHLSRTNDMNEFSEKQTVRLNAKTKGDLMRAVGQLRDGLYDIQIKERKRTRTLDANAYYFAAVVTPFQLWLTDQWGESVSKEVAHKALAQRILGVDNVTVKGEVMAEIPRSTASLDVGQFSEYIEGCARFLAEFCGVVVIPSDLWWKMKQEAA